MTTKKTYFCETCGEEIEKDAIEGYLEDEAKGETAPWLCDSCWCEGYSRCSVCGEIVTNDVITEGSELCPGCAERLL
jgi:DNA-directed RNA polymerase subunit RPC12/RpoP